MKTTHAVIITFLASVLFSFPVFAEECDKEVINVTPPQGSYKQITDEEAKKMKNYTPPGQHEISVQGEYSQDQGDVKRNNKSLDTDAPKVLNVEPKVESVTPPQGSYKQITDEEAKKMKNYTPPGQHEISVQGEYSQDQGDVGKK